MNNKLFKLGALLVVLLALSLATAFGQTVYVDVTNGSDTYTGVNSTNSPAGTGPLATINAGIGKLANGGTLVIFAGTYNGGDGAGAAINITTAALTGITFEFRQLNSNQQVLLSAGSFTYNVTGGVLTVAATNGTEYMTVNDLILGSSTKNSSMNIPVASYVQVASNNTVTLWGTSAFTNQAPQKTTNIQVSYQGGTSVVAGPESNYGTYGTGTITVNKTAGTSVTFNNAMTLGGLNVTSGDATFNGAVTMGVYDMQNTSTGTVTFASTVGLSVVTSTTNDVGTILNTSTGSIVFNGAVTWTGTNTTNVIGQAVTGQYFVENQSTGSILINSSISLVASDGAAARNVSGWVYNNGGTLTLGAVTAAATTTNSNSFTLSAYNAAVGTGVMNVSGGTFRGDMFNGAGATTNILGATTVGGLFTNAGTVATSSNMLTLSGASAHATNGGTVTSAAGGGITVTAGGSSFNGGTLGNLTINHGTAATTTISGAVNASNLTVTKGTLSIGAATTVATAGTTTVNGGTLAIGAFTFTTGGFTQSSGTVTLTNNVASILDLKGSFNRTAGTFTNGGASSIVKFTGTGAQSFNGGPLIQVGDLSFTNTAATITLGQSVRVQGNCTINASTNLALGTLNIILIGNASAMTNNGTYTASGGGGVIFGGSTTVSGGLAATSQTISGTGVYSYITIDVGANDVQMASVQDVKFNGVLTLTSGNLEVNAGGGTFGPTGTAASIIRNIATSGGSAKGVWVNAGGFNTNSPVDYDLQYTGAMTATNTLNTGGTVGAEFTLGNVKNLTISVTQPSSTSQTENTLDVVSAGAMTIKGNFTLTAPASTFVNQITLPAQNLTINGALTVGSGSYILNGNAANPIALAGDAMTHSVAGTISAAGILTVTGSGSALNGSTVSGDPATVNSVAFEPAANNSNFTSSNLKTISGNLTIEGVSTKTGTTATIAMGATDANLTGNLVIGNTTLTPAVTVTIAGTSTSTHGGALTLTNGTLTYTRGGAGSTIGGAVTLTAGTLTLGSSITVTGATTMAAGNLTMGTFSYTQLGSGASPDFNRTGAGALTATTGALILDGTTALDLTPGATFSVPRLTFKAGTIGINAAMTVSDVLTNTAGAVTLGGALTFSGNTHTFTAGSIAGSALIYTGTAPTATFAASVGINSITVNTDGIFTIADKAATPAVARTVTVAGTFTQTKGDVALGINSLTITGTFTRTAGNWTMGTGYLVFNTATAFTQGTGFAVDNLEIDQSISAASLTTAMSVNKNLLIKGGTLTINAGKLTLGDGCLVERQADAAMLSSIPTFAGAVSVKYTTAGPISTAANFNELPATVTNFSVITPSSATLPKNVTVNGTLTLSGVLTTTATTKNITMADGSSLVLQAAGTTVLPVTGLVLPASPGKISITYDGTFSVTTRELGTVTSGAYDNAVNNVTFKSGTTTLDNNLTIAGTTTFSGGTFAMAAKTVTVQGSITQTSATSFFSSTATGTVQFTGAAAQTLTLKADLSWPVNVSFKLSKTNATDALTLTGGNLDFATNTPTVTFTKGLLATGTAYVVTLKQGSASGQPTQGYTRTSGHVVGQVKKFVDKTDVIAISRVEFPVGTADGFYRPFAIYFKNTPQASVNLTVAHSNVRPGGQNGYPIHDGALVITNYPNFYWYVKSDLSLAPSYLFDMEAQAEGYADYAADGIQNMRFVRRDSGLVSNQWVEQKNNNTNTVLYDNSTIAANWPAVKVVDATGGVTTQGSIFSFSQINKAPVFNPAPTSMTKNEGDTVSVTFTAVDPDLGDVAVMSATVKPTGSTFDASTGKFTWVLGYDLASKTTPTATATVTIRATDTYGPLSKDTSIVITINNVNRAPKFNPRTVTSTPKDTDTLKVTLAATDADADALTYTYLSATPTPTNVPTVAGTVLTWKPAFADIGLTFTIKALVSDGAGGTDTLTVSATVGRSVKRGDVDGNGTVQAADASVVLKHVAGITLITDAAALYAADATNNGTISAFDAAYILQAAAGLITLPASATSSDNLSLNKIGVAAGTLSLSSPEATKDAEVVKVALKLSNAANVYAAQLTSKADFSLMSIEGVSAALPEGWQMQWNVVDNELRVAMAGTTPLSSGEVAAITVRLKNKESRLNFSSDAMLNESSQSLGAVEIAAVPTTFALELNYPNPFNPSTTMKYQIPNDANVSLDVYNLQGQKIRTLVAKEQKAGYYSVVWDGRNEAGQTVSSGLYLYRVQAGSFVAVHKMMLIK